MARMIPDIDPGSIENSGERAAYKELKSQLPSGWVVRHHYPFCWKDGKWLRDGEADFIVLAPNRGLMLVEVKGSHGFDSRDGAFYRVKSDGTREETRNPFEQAMCTKHRLVERISEKVFNSKKTGFPGTFGHLVMYPNGKVEGALPGSAEPVLMITHRHMKSLLEKFEAAFDSWGGAAQRFHGQAMGSVIQFLSDASRGVPVFAANLEEDEQRIEELTKLQFSTFKGLLREPRVHVTGPAGSGKTLLAQWTAQHLTASGEKILLTCYNRVLAEWLSHLHGSNGSFEIQSFFSLCRKIVMKAKLGFSPDNTPDFWSKNAPNLFMEAIDILSETGLQKYDGIVVDEAQDFHPDWWMPLMLLLKDPSKGRLCIFSDSDQRGVYGQAGAVPAKLVSFELQENCRNTRQIANYSGNIVGRAISTTPLQPEGLPPVILDGDPAPSKRAKIARNLVTKFMDKGFRADQIALLSLYSTKNPACSLTQMGTIHNLSVAGGKEHVREWKSGNVLWGSTIKAFKGLEAACIIVTDAKMGTDEDSVLADLYVGATRAKHQLALVPVSTEDQKSLREFLD